MPLIEVPTPSWSTLPTLKRSKKFKRLADEALALTWLAKFVEARRKELSIELYDVTAGALPEGIKTLTYDDAEIDRDRLMEILDALVPEDSVFDVIHAATMTAKAGGPSSRFNPKKLLATPIPCSNPKCKTENFVTVDVIEACTKHGERRAGVTIKLAGEEEEE